MLTGEIRNQIDAIWNAFWSGGISNPLEVIEQITYLFTIPTPALLAKVVDMLDKVPRDGLASSIAAPTIAYRDHVVAWGKDLRRTVDYLETRPDIDIQKLSYMGFSWGAAMGRSWPRSSRASKSASS